MDMTFTAEHEAFRQDVRDFIADAYDGEMRAAAAKAHSAVAMPRDLQVRWQKRLSARGWLAPGWPEEYGGPGWDQTQKYIFDQEMSRAGAPAVVGFGLKLCAPVIMGFGTAAQKARFLPDILAAKTWWAQGYSEPGAGSDLAALQCKAENKGDHYLVTGSKLWTTQAQFADWIFCLVRTSKEEKRQDGISFLLIEMSTPGITVEPIITIDGPSPPNQEVNQVFFDEVRVPVENRIGEEGKGWTYAKYLLEFERGNAYSGRVGKTVQKAREIAEQEQSDGRRLIDEPAFQAKLAAAEVQVKAIEMTELRILSRLASGQRMGPESSMMKCRGSEMIQLASELVLEATAYGALPFQPVNFGGNEPPIGPDYAAAAAPRYFNSRKVSIFAGSNEIQHNIMAKRILGL